MSAGVDVAVRGTVSAPATGVRARVAGAARSATLWVIAAVIVLIAAIVTVLLQGREATLPLHYDSTQAEGGRAFVEVLSSQGRDVTTTESLEDARTAASGGGTLLVFAGDSELAEQVPGELVDSAEASGTDIVLIDPADRVPEWTDGIELDFQDSEDLPPPRRAPECEAPVALTAGAVSTRGAGLDYYATSTAADGPEFCYPNPGESTADAGLVDHGLYVEEDRGAMTLTVLGSQEWLQNQYLADEGHMSLVAGAVAGEGQLTYYYPQAGDQPGADEDPGGAGAVAGLFPYWLQASLLWLLPVLAVAMLVYGRRLGPLAIEPLPVVVPAAETVVGRSALLQRARARETAVQELRTAALVRLGRRLALGPEVPTAEVAARAASAAGVDRAWAESVLLTAPVPDDAALLRLSQDITLIEREVDTL